LRPISAGNAVQRYAASAARPSMRPCRTGLSRTYRRSSNRVLLGIDTGGREAVLEDVSDAGVACVEAQGVTQVDALEHVRHRRTARLDERVVVIAEERPREAARAGLREHQSHRGDEMAPVVVVLEQGAARDPAGSHVMERAWLVETGVVVACK